jgi:hypothetical protein
VDVQRQVDEVVVAPLELVVGVLDGSSEHGVPLIERVSRSRSTVLYE